MKFVPMRGQSDSAIACLAMVTGVSYVEAAKLLYEGGPYKPATQSMICAALERAELPHASTGRKVYGWADVPQPSIVRTLLDPSDTWWHWVVLALGMVFDPGLVAPIRPDHCWRPPISCIVLTKEKVAA